jgi:hypothetical protein
VSARTFERLLLTPLASGDYATVLARVSRWPTLYRVKVVLDAVFEALKVCKFVYTAETTFATAVARVPPESICNVAILLVTLFKLYEFANQFTEAAQVVVLYLLVRLLRVPVVCMLTSRAGPATRGGSTCR